MVTLGNHPITHIFMLLINNMIMSKRSLLPCGGGLGWGGHGGENERNFERSASILTPRRRVFTPTPALHKGGGGLVGNRVHQRTAFSSVQRLAHEPNVLVDD